MKRRCRTACSGRWPGWRLGRKQTDSPTNYVVDVATEADYEYVQDFGGSTEANSEIEGILNVVEGVLSERAVGQAPRLSFQHAWTVEG